MKYRMIFSDFDNTLLRSDLTVAPETIASIKNYRERGGKFVLVTGRSIESAIEQAKMLGLSGEVVASMGAVIADIDTGVAQLECGLDVETAVRVIEDAERLGEEVYCYVKRKLYVPVYNDVVQRYENIVRSKANVTGGKLSEYVRSRGETVEKVMVFCLPEDARKIVAQKSAAFGESVSVVMSAPFMVEFISPAYTKGKAVKYMAEKCGVPIAETLAVGDSTNDLEMILAAGHGVAVSNAMPELLAVADEVTVSCDEDAIGTLIRKYGM